MKLKVSALPREDETGIKASSADPKAGREGLDVHAVEFSKTEPVDRQHRKAPDSCRRPLEVDTECIRLLSKGSPVVSRG